MLCREFATTAAPGCKSSAEGVRSGQTSLTIAPSLALYGGTRHGKNRKNVSAPRPGPGVRRAPSAGPADLRPPRPRAAPTRNARLAVGARLPAASRLAVGLAARDRDQDNRGRLLAHRRRPAGARVPRLGPAAALS